MPRLTRPPKGQERPLCLHPDSPIDSIPYQIVGRDEALHFVAHDAGEHVVDIRQFLVHEERALAARDGRNQLR